MSSHMTRVTALWVVTLILAAGALGVAALVLGVGMVSLALIID